MSRLLRWLYYGVLVRLVVLIVIGLNVRHRDRLPNRGPAILAANHNSHLDAMVLATLLPLRLLGKIRPVAAADYFLKNPVLAWFSQRVIGILPIQRGGAKAGGNPLAEAELALDRGEILVIFPEGSRGEPEQMAELKNGIGFLAKARPSVPVVPIFLHGLGKSLPKGSFALVPFSCDVFVGKPLFGRDQPKDFVATLGQRLKDLAAEGSFPSWD